jgi:hypothetical protein
MKIFKELKKLGYIHYSATTIEELDDLPLDSEERIMEQAMVLRWFREKYGLYSAIDGLEGRLYYKITQTNEYSKEYNTYEEAELACLNKIIEITKKKQHEK